MVIDAQIVVNESNKSEMCIWNEFIKVDVFGFNLNFVLLETQLVQNYDSCDWKWNRNKMNKSWNFGCDEIEFFWEWSNKIKHA